MRSWVEKLAKTSKEKGVFYCMHVTVENLDWDIDQYYRDYKEKNYTLCIRNINKDGNVDNQCWIKLYEDEVDLLKETIEYCENKAKDYILNKIESFN